MNPTAKPWSELLFNPSVVNVERVCLQLEALSSSSRS